MEIKINKLQKILNIKFNNINILIQAITHKSFNSKINYEILEFLGDRVLGLTRSKTLIELYPKEKVGILDKKLANSTIPSLFQTLINALFITLPSSYIIYFHIFF